MFDMIEIEKRVLLAKNDLTRVRTFLDRNASKQDSFKRFTLVNVPNSDFTQDPENAIDLKIRTSGEEALLTLKKGNWHKDTAREEYEVRFETSQIAELLNILVALGKRFFVAIYVFRSKYRYRDFII